MISAPGPELFSHHVVFSCSTFYIFFIRISLHLLFSIWKNTNLLSLSQICTGKWLGKDLTLVVTPLSTWWKELTFNILLLCARSFTESYWHLYFRWGNWPRKVACSKSYLWVCVVLKKDCALLSPSWMHLWTPCFTVDSTDPSWMGVWRGQESLRFWRRGLACHRSSPSASLALALEDLTLSPFFILMTTGTFSSWAAMEKN